MPTGYRFYLSHDGTYNQKMTNFNMKVNIAVNPHPKKASRLFLLKGK